VITEVLYEVEAESWLNTRSLSYDRIRPILCTSHDLKINIVYIWKSITLWCITTTFLCRPRYVLKHILFLRWIAVLASLQQLIYFQSSGPLCPWRGDWIEQLQMSTSGSTKTEWKTKNHPNEVFKVNFYCNILFIMTVLQNMKIC